MGWLSNILFGFPPKGNSITPKGMPQSGILDIENFGTHLAILDPKEGQGILFSVIRQSGNTQRQEMYWSRENALKAVKTQFRRMIQPDGRVWRNTETYVDIRRAYYHGRGSNEGKVIMGVVLELVDAEPN